MPVTERTFDVAAPVPIAVDYLKDFGNAEEWDPGTQTCTRQDTGPIAVGATWRNVSKIVGKETELAYTLEAMSDDHLTFVGKNKTATATDDISFATVAGRTRITYRSDIEFHGLAKVAGPLLAPKFESLGDETQARLTAILDGKA
jgi:carbon monoxide dehydrogenase subunit G